MTSEEFSCRVNRLSRAGLRADAALPGHQRAVQGHKGSEKGH